MKIQLYLDSYKKLSGTLVPNCKKCRSKKLRKDGKYKIFQQYKCKIVDLDLVIQAIYQEELIAKS